MTIFNKQPLTYAQQVALLQSRGLIVPDVAKAESYLSQISYYRLSAYFLPLQQVKDVFNKNTTFDDVLNLYSFDRELRLLVFDAIERIEVSIRVQMIYQLSHKYGSHWQDDATIFNAPSSRGGRILDVFNETQALIQKHTTVKHPEVFIKHYINNYSSPINPPSWMSIELLTIGELSRLYTALKNNADRKDIAAYFGLHHTVFTSWLHSLVYVRNICAHHSRLWNRDLAIKPDVLLKPVHPWLQPAFDNNNHRSFYFISTLKYLLQAANPTSHFTQKLQALVTKYPNTPIQFMGIPTNATTGALIEWNKEPIWLN